MIREELEFRIARYADGDPTEAERLGVEAELAGDPEARAMLAEYQTLRTAIEEAAGPALPKVHWDRLEQLLSNAVAWSAAASAAGGESEASGGTSEASDGPFAGELGIEHEFAVACLADGSLSPDRRAEVEKLLAGDARARALFDEYHDLDAATKALAYCDAPPVVGWDCLAKQISDAVGTGASAGFSEDVERQMAAFAEGALSADECEAVESRLAADPWARIMASDYRNLDAALRAVAVMAPLPAVDWERFSAGISAAIDREAVVTAVRSRKSRGYRIINWLRSPTRLALAASVLIGVALVTRLMHGGGGPVARPMSPGVAVTPQRVESIAVLTPEPPGGGVQSEISIGPPTVAQAGNDDETGDDGVISRTPRAFVASGRSTSSEADALPAIPY